MIAPPVCSTDTRHVWPGPGSRGLLLGLCVLLLPWASLRQDAYAAPKSRTQALSIAQEIRTYFKEAAPGGVLSPASVHEKLRELDEALPLLSPRNQSLYALLVGKHLLEAERKALEVSEKQILGPAVALDDHLTLGEERILKGISLANTLEQFCSEAWGYRVLIEHFLKRPAADFNRAYALLLSAEAASMACDTTHTDSDMTLWGARAKLSLLWADLYRDEGDRIGQFEALTATVALAEAESQTAQLAQYRLLELRQDLGDVTFGVEAYEPFINPDDWVTRGNVRIIQASLALDRHQPAQALETLRLLEKDPELSDDPAIHTMLMAYRARALLASTPPDLPGAEEALGKAQQLSSSAVLLERQLGTLTQIEGEVALAGGAYTQAWKVFHAALVAGDHEEELGWRALKGLAEVSLARRAPTTARQFYAQALSRLEQQRRSFAHDFWELPYVTQVQPLYDATILLLLDEALQGQPSPPQPEDAAQARDPLQLRGTPDDLLTLVAKRASLSFAAALMQDSSGLRLEDCAQYRALQRLVSGELVSGAALRQGLSAGQVTYLFLPLPECVLILEVRREGTRIHRVPFDQDAWDEVETLHKAMRGSPTAPPLELTSLGERLLAPVWAQLPSGEHPAAFILLGELEKLPLPALRFGGQYLVERTTPYELPFLHADRLLPRPSEQGSDRALSISEETGLHFAQRQAELLEELDYQTTRLETPTLEQVRGALAQPSALVVFGTHAEAPRAARIETSGRHVVFKPGVEAALLLANAERLTATELRRQDFRGARVILSACETRVGDALTLDHSQGALHRAVLEAHAASVLASRWKVGDRATFALLGHLLRHLPTSGMAVALARAQRALLTGKGLELAPGARAALEEAPGAAGEPPLVAPWSWAGFTVIGRPE